MFLRLTGRRFTGGGAPDAMQEIIVDAEKVVALVPHEGGVLLFTTGVTLFVAGGTEDIATMIDGAGGG